jgi:hypothetical protein
VPRAKTPEVARAFLKFIASSNGAALELWS